MWSINLLNCSSIIVSHNIVETPSDRGPGDEPSYGGSNRGRIRGWKIERPLLEVTRGRRLIEGISPVRNRGLIETTLKNDGHENRDFMRPKMEQWPQLEKSEAEKRVFCDLPIRPFLEQPQVTSNRPRPRLHTRPPTGLIPWAMESSGESINSPADSGFLFRSSPWDTLVKRKCGGGVSVLSYWCHQWCAGISRGRKSSSSFWCK